MLLLVVSEVRTVGAQRGCASHNETVRRVRAKADYICTVIDVPTSKYDNVLVCSGGGVHGAAQAGMIAVLAAAGFVPDAMVGVSAGALNATFMGAEFTSDRAEELCKIWEGLDRKSVFPARSATQLVHVLAGHQAVQPDKGLRALIERCTPVADLSETTIETHVGAVCVTTGELVWWSSGPAVIRLCASSALPGVVKPVEVEGRTFFDGGVLANVPVPKAVALGARRIVVLDVAAQSVTDKPPESALGVLLRAFAHARAALHEYDMAQTPSSVEVIVISGRLPALEPSAFENGEELVALGRVIAKKAIADNPTILHPPQPRDEPTPTRTYGIRHWLPQRRNNHGRKKGYQNK